MSRLLRNHLGLEVATAGNGRQAIAEALTGDYHAAIIDLLLPRTSGLKAIKAIKEMKPDFPIIALTSDSEKKRSELVESSGVTQLFSKPVRIPVLFEELIRILSADRNLPVGNYNSICNQGGISAPIPGKDRAGRS
jgi:CheY-like chemotaxis protein